jgi:hypothetical protein
MRYALLNIIPRSVLIENSGNTGECCPQTGPTCCQKFCMALRPAGVGKLMSRRSLQPLTFGRPTAVEPTCALRAGSVVGHPGAVVHPLMENAARKKTDYIWTSAC